MTPSPPSPWWYGPPHERPESSHSSNYTFRGVPSPPPGGRLAPGPPPGHVPDPYSGEPRATGPLGPALRGDREGDRVGGPGDDAQQRRGAHPRQGPHPHRRPPQGAAPPPIPPHPPRCQISPIRRLASYLGLFEFGGKIFFIFLTNREFSRPFNGIQKKKKKINRIFTFLIC